MSKHLSKRHFHCMLIYLCLSAESLAHNSPDKRKVLAKTISLKIVLRSILMSLRSLKYLQCVEAYDLYSVSNPHKAWLDTDWYRSRYKYANVYHSMVVTQILYHVELAAYDRVTVNGSDSFLYIQVLHLRFMLLFFLALLVSFFLFEAQSCGFYLCSRGYCLI